MILILLEHSYGLILISDFIETINKPNRFEVHDNENVICSPVRK